jgi:hypothetical protein
MVTLGDTSTCPVECGLCTLSFKGIILRTALHVMSSKSVIFAHAILKPGSLTLTTTAVTTTFRYKLVSYSELQSLKSAFQPRYM